MSEHKTFFALRPDPAAAAQAGREAARLRRVHRSDGWQVPAARLHVSLARVAGDTASVERAMAAASAVRRPIFRVSFNQVAAFGSGERRPLVLLGDEGVVGVDNLRDDLVTALAATGDRRRGPAFRAHMSLIWDRRALERQVLDEPVSWWVREFVLIRSWTGEGRHELIGRWPLTA